MIITQATDTHGERRTVRWIVVILALIGIIYTCMNSNPSNVIGKNVWIATTQSYSPAEGALISTRGTNSDTIFYQIYGGTKHLIPNEKTFIQLFGSVGKAVHVDASVANKIPTGHPYGKDARVIQCDGFGDLFFAHGREKRWICDDATVTKYGFAKWIMLSLNECKHFWNGHMLCSKRSLAIGAASAAATAHLKQMGITSSLKPTDGTIFKCGDEKIHYQMMHAKKRLIPDTITFENLYGIGGWDKVLTYPSDFCGKIESGPTYSKKSRVVKCQGFSHKFLASNGEKHWLCDEDTYQAFHLRSDAIHTLSLDECRKLCTGKTTCLAAAEMKEPEYSQLRGQLCCGKQSRIRRDWLHHTRAEKERYLKGFMKMKRNGKLHYFISEHMQAGKAHHTNRFLAWHRYYIWEFEEQIRALGDEYRCFGLPFWDWTHGAGEPVHKNPIWDDDLVGGDGKPCVLNGLFSEKAGYRLSKLNGDGCLKREFAEGSNWYHTSPQVLALIERKQSYVDFLSSWQGQHDKVHASVCGDLCVAPPSPNDPVFWMLHGFVDFVWGVRSDCHNYDDAPKNTEEIYPGDRLHTHMFYPVLATQRWTLQSKGKITMRRLLKMKLWKYTYDASPIIARSNIKMSKCNFRQIIHDADDIVFPQDAHHLAHLVNMDVQRFTQTNVDASDDDIARFSCKRMQELSVQYGYQKRVCKYTEPLETCGSGSELDISLDDMLNRRGVRGNECIVKARKAIYAFAKEEGTLRGLCNGYSDPVC